MSNIGRANFMFLNLDSVTNVFRWNGQFAARLTGAIAESRHGDYAFVQSAGMVVAIGRATKFMSCDFSEDRSSITSVCIDISPLAFPTMLSSKQLRELEVLTKLYRCPFPGLDNVFAVPDSSAHCFRSLAEQLSKSHTLPALGTAEWQLNEFSRILGRTDIDARTKVHLCETLDNTGDIVDLVYQRDTYRVNLEEDLDWVVTRIVPWEACNDSQKTDPDNYVLMDRHLAEHFAVGMVSFQNTGQQIQDPAMDELSFDSHVDPNFATPPLNKKQNKYMAYHREHVYKQWRSVTAKRIYASSK